MLIAGFVSWCDRKQTRRADHQRTGRLESHCCPNHHFDIRCRRLGIGVAYTNIELFWMIETLMIALSLDQRGTYTIVQNAATRSEARRSDASPQASRGDLTPDSEKHGPSSSRSDWPRGVGRCGRPRRGGACLLVRIVWSARTDGISGRRYDGRGRGPSDRPASGVWLHQHA